MNYEPTPVPLGGDPKAIIEHLARELRRISNSLRDDSDTVHYRTLPANQGSLTAGVSANYKIVAGNVVRISSSATVTLTGLAYKIPNKEVALVNVGTGVVVLKHEGTESSASYRFALSESLWQLSANAAATIWYDAASARWRGIGRT